MVAYRPGSASRPGSAYPPASAFRPEAADAPGPYPRHAAASPRNRSTASSTASTTAPALTMSVAAVPVTAGWMTERITRHGDPIDTMSLACDVCLSMADPPMASAAPAVAANPAPSAASGGQSSRHDPRRRQHPYPSARASPRPARAIVTLIANPSPTRTPAAAARASERAGQRLAWPGGAAPGIPGLVAGRTTGYITATAATPKT